MSEAQSNSAMTNAPDAIEIVRRFAIALDGEDYEAGLGLLDAGCVYTIRGETIVGPGAIIDSYRGNGDTAAQVFDGISYGSEVAGGADGWIVIRFFDRIVHAGQRLDHACEQWVRVGGGRVVRIEHHDLPGERERLEAFKAAHGV
jgi:ketosteroid isomerase-like protein